jgi:hypothetical protein
MNAPLSEWTAPAPGNTYLHTSPYTGAVDFSPLEKRQAAGDTIDHVSLADLLRNGFVYPPHTIYRDVKNLITGFTQQGETGDELRFHFAYQAGSAASRPAPDTISDDELLRTYHELLVRAVQRCTANMRQPWVLQSGGKDSTSLAIAMADARPDTICVTYLGGKEENEVASAHFVARKLGLRHVGLVCDPARAYDRYLAMVPNMPLLTADFATLAYADLATEITKHEGDGIIDALGVDPFIGSPLHLRDYLLPLLARRARIPGTLLKQPPISRSFKLCFALGTLQMSAFERNFPGSRFSDAEVDDLFERHISARSHERLNAFQEAIEASESPEGVRRIVLVVLEAAGFAKGMYVAKAAGSHLAYPYCDWDLCEWIFNHVPDNRLIGPGGVNKVLMRQHIARHFQELPYVRSKGSFRFDVAGLAQQRFEQVHDFAVQARSLLPGASKWLEEHRHCMGNKFFASKFYLLAVTLPWLLSRLEGAVPASND